MGVHDADDVLVMLKGQEVEDYEATVGSSGIEDGEILQADKQTFHTHVAAACAPGVFDSRCDDSVKALPDLQSVHTGFGLASKTSPRSLRQLCWQKVG